MKLSILDSYCSVGRITRELRLSAFVIIALLVGLDRFHSLGFRVCLFIVG
jgi:hypothetical protein